MVKPILFAFRQFNAALLAFVAHTCPAVAGERIATDAVKNCFPDAVAAHAVQPLIAGRGAVGKVHRIHHSAARPDRRAVSVAAIARGTLAVGGATTPVGFCPGRTCHASPGNRVATTVVSGVVRITLSLTRTTGGPIGARFANIGAEINTPHIGVIRFHKTTSHRISGVSA